MTNQNSSNNKRIAKNTLLLYFRMFITMTVSLYTSRIVLNTLGVEDYGIYNVVGGTVAMFSLLSGSLSAAISRFLTFELGKDDKDKLKTIFSTSVNIQVGLSLIVLVLAETIGVWFLNNKMVIPADRVVAANWVLQCSIATFMINLISIPYNASIVAHEHMKAFAYVSVLEVVLKLLVVYLLVLSLMDKLIFYGFLLLGVSIMIRLIYGFYCKYHFIECSYHYVFDKKVLRDMTGFAGWNFLGAGSGLLMTQGVNMLMNIFFGVTVNAARGIAEQVNTAVMAFVTNFSIALNPQITKSYASNNKEYMFSLMCSGAKYSYFLLLVLSLPIIFQTETILSVWLSQQPEYASNFVRMTLLISLLSVLSNTMVTAMLATGHIKRYQIIVGGIGMLVFPLSWIAYKAGFSPITAYFIHFGIFCIQLIYRLFLLREMVGFSIRLFLNKVLSKVTITTIVAFILPALLTIFIPTELYWTRFISIVSISLLSSVVAIYIFGLSSEEKSFVNSKICEIKYKILK